jgi:hypothetical protein
MYFLSISTLRAQCTFEYSYAKDTFDNISEKSIVCTYVHHDLKFRMLIYYVQQKQQSLSACKIQVVSIRVLDQFST